MTMNWPLYSILLPTGGLSRWRFSAIQRSRWNGIGNDMENPPAKGMWFTPLVLYPEKVAACKPSRRGTGPRQPNCIVNATTIRPRKPQVHHCTSEPLRFFGRAAELALLD